MIPFSSAKGLHIASALLSSRVPVKNHLGNSYESNMHGLKLPANAAGNPAVLRMTAGYMRRLVVLRASSYKNNQAREEK